MLILSAFFTVPVFITHIPAIHVGIKETVRHPLTPYFYAAGANLLNQYSMLLRM